MRMSPLRENQGQGMPEYALIIVLAVIIMIVVLVVLGSQISEMYSQIVSGFNK